MPTVKDIVVRKPSFSDVAECKKWDTWESPIKTFDWDYSERETFLVIQGKATVKNPDKSDSVSFGKGDLVIMPKDLACIWVVEEDLKKYYSFG